MSFMLGRKRPMDEVVPGLFYGQVYYTLGPGPKDGAPSEISDPPNSGWGTALVMQEEKGWRLFSVWHLKSWLVSERSYEFISLQGTWDDMDRLRERMRDRLPSYYAAHKLRGWESDYATTERIMKLLGVEVPTSEEEWLRLCPSAARHAEDPRAYAICPDEALRSGYRPPAARKAPKQSGGGRAPDATVGGLKKPVKKEGRKGEVLAFMMEAGGTGSVSSAVERFGISRSNLLSQLFLLRKEHNIGYTVNGDTVSIQLPEGCTDPFADKQGD